MKRAEPRRGPEAAAAKASRAAILTWIDMPPVWLCLMIALAWGQLRLLPIGPVAPPGLVVAGAALIAAGLGLLGLAALQFRRARTTIIPHRSASRLMTRGLYAWSRNPIYLGDVLMLFGAILLLGAWPSLVLVPLFMAILTRRFIAPEEARLQASFGAAFDAYAARTGRWI